MATRYSDKEKEDVVAFVKAYDEKYGRGGQAAAKKEFKINPISIKKWCVERGYRPGKSGAKVKRGRPAQSSTAVAAPAPAPAAPKASRAVKASRATKAKPGRGGARRKLAPAPAPAKTPFSSDPGVSKALARMVEIQVEIERLQGEFDSLKTTEVTDTVRKLLS